MKAMLVFFPIHTEYRNASAIWLLDTFDHLDQRSFASPIRSKQSHKFTFIDSEAEVINGCNILKSFGDFRDLYRGCFRHLRFNIVRGNKGNKTVLRDCEKPYANLKRIQSMRLQNPANIFSERFAYRNLRCANANKSSFDCGNLRYCHKIGFMRTYKSTNWKFCLNGF